MEESCREEAVVVCFGPPVANVERGRCPESLQGTLGVPILQARFSFLSAAARCWEFLGLCRALWVTLPADSTNPQGLRLQCRALVCTLCSVLTKGGQALAGRSARARMRDPASLAQLSGVVGLPGSLQLV